uniref:Uncharacterized protein n=1 Tax=Arundo donax TaxID=35708 RepID=A0A0A9F7U3_ARUDO
MRGRGTVCSTL